MSRTKAFSILKSFYPINAITFSMMMLYPIFIQADAAITPTPVPDICPKGAFVLDSVNRYCFTINEQPLSFWKAELFCQEQKGWHLATILRHQQQQVIHDKLGHVGNATKYWIGLNDIREEGMFKWSSGFPALLNVFWADGQPDNAVNSEDCVAMNKEDVFMKSWYDEHCAVKLPFICSNGSHYNFKPTKYDWNNSVCPEGFFPLGDRCFRIEASMSAGYSWDEARTQCQRHWNHSELATISSIMEQSYLTAYLTKTDKNVWIGLHKESGDHRWVSGKEVVFTNWKIGEPNGAAKESCVMMYRRIHNPGEWNDEKCSSRMGYICEAYPINASNSSQPQQAHGPLFQQQNCSAGFYQFENVCYSVIPGPLVTVEEAEQICSKTPGGMALVMHTRTAAAFARALLWRYGNASCAAWLGFKAQYVKPLNWIVGSVAVTSPDNSDMGFDDFIRDWQFFSKISETRQTCLTLSAQSVDLEPVSCNETLAIPACIYYQENHPLHPNFKNFTCADDKWSQFGAYCYYIGAKMSHDEGVQECEKRKSTLVSLHSLTEQMFVGEMLRKIGGHGWIGMNMEQYFDGDKTGIHLSWDDGSTVDFTHFRTNEPSLTSRSGKNESCFQLIETKHEWNDVTCNKAFRYICKKPAVLRDFTVTTPSPSTAKLSTPATAQVTTPHPACPQGYSMYFNGTCYAYITEKQDWRAAEKKCRDMKGHLTSIHSADEENAIVKKLKLPMYGDFWIGFWRGNSYGMDYLGAWMDNTIPDYTNAAKNLSNTFGLDVCFRVVYQQKNGKISSVWQAENCGHQKPYVCQHYLKSMVTQANNNALWKPVTGKYCPHGYKQYRNKCYRLVKKKMTWEAAKDNCVVPGKISQSGLARIDTPGELEYLLSMFNDIPDEMGWIGLYAKSVHGPYVWSDHNPTLYMRLPFVLPSDSRSPSDLSCVGLQPSNHPNKNGIWLSLGCTRELPSVCYTERYETKVDNTPYPCPDKDAVYFNGSCYLQRGRLNYAAGQAACQQWDKEAHLLYLENTFEASFIRSWLYNNTIHDPWLGLSLHQEQRNWRWTSGHPVRFTDWSQPPKNPLTGCLSLSVNSLIHDPTRVGPKDEGMLKKDCWTPHMTVCKKKVTTGDVTTDLAKDRLCAPLTGDGKLYQLNVPQTGTQKPCIRWDLVGDQMYHLYSTLSVSSWVGGGGYPSFAENFCSNYSNAHEGTVGYGCYTSTKMDSFEACTLVPCSGSVFGGHTGKGTSQGSVAGMVIGILLGILAIVAAIIMSIMLWRNSAGMRQGFRPFFVTSEGRSSDAGTSFLNPVYKPVTIEC